MVTAPTDTTPAPDQQFHEADPFAEPDTHATIRGNSQRAQGPPAEIEIVVSRPTSLPPITRPGRQSNTTTTALVAAQEGKQKVMRHRSREDAQGSGAPNRPEDDSEEMVFVEEQETAANTSSNATFER